MTPVVEILNQPGPRGHHAVGWDVYIDRRFHSRHDRLRDAKHYAPKAAGVTGVWRKVDYQRHRLEVKP